MHFVNHEQLRGFDLCRSPIWIFDLDRHGIWWGNRAAAAFWQAADLDSLLTRDFSGDSEIVRTRLRHLVEASRASGPISEQWTLYPNNEPVDALIAVTAVRIGRPERDALLIEVERSGAVDPLAQRILDAARIAPFCVSMIGEDGSVIAANPAAIEAYGDPRAPDGGLNRSVFARFPQPGLFEALVDGDGGRLSEDVEVVTLSGRRWRRLAVQRGRDPVDGAPALVLTEEDTTERVGLIRKLEDANRLLEARIEEKERTETELRIAKDEADHASRAKSQFLAAMSHELRTPMNAILGFAQLLEMNREARCPEVEVKAPEQILAAGRHLMALIESLLDLAQIESGNLAVTLETVHVGAAIEECLAMTRAFAVKHGVRVINGDGGMSPVLVRADPTRLRQVLLNLLSNAVKFNRADGLVTVSTHVDDSNSVRISVEDTGPGVPPDRAEELFQPFNRLGLDTGDVQGTGIGLSITKRLVGKMNGEISFRNRPEGGAVFSLTLPTVGAREAPAKSEAEAPPAVVDPGSKATVLYVEDSNSNVELMRTLIDQMGDIALQWAPDARIGVEMATAHPPDLVIMDVNLPGMDGFDALRRLREESATARVPVIAVSALASPDDIRRGRQAGFDLYLPKPLDIGDLTRAIRDRLQPVA